MYKVVVISSFHEQGLALLRRDDIELHVVDDFSHESLSRALKDADAVTVRTIPLTPELLDFAPRLRIVSRFGVGTDNIPVDYLSNRGIPVAIAVDSNVTTVAEHTLMMLLALAKRAFEGDRAVREDHFAWRNDHPTSDLRDKTILLVGYGRIGRRVAHLCRAFDMRVEVYDPYLPQESAESITLAPDLFEALGRADAVSLHIPYTQETRHLMGRRAFAALKPGALLVNCSRGETVDETALVGALREGRLGGAGLDVFEGEIPPQDSPLLHLDGVLLSPHNAALSTEGSNPHGHTGCAKRPRLSARQTPPRGRLQQSAAWAVMTTTGGDDARDHPHQSGNRFGFAPGTGEGRPAPRRQTADRLDHRRRSAA